MKKNQKVSYLSCDWSIVAIDDSHVILKSINKNIKNVRVPHRYKKEIHIGGYKSPVSSVRLNGAKVFK